MLNRPRLQKKLAMTFEKTNHPLPRKRNAAKTPITKGTPVERVVAERNIAEWEDVAETNLILEQSYFI
ncbi:hypothetical protein TB1_026825 [Malus domestica]